MVIAHTVALALAAGRTGMTGEEPTNASAKELIQDITDAFSGGI